MFFFQTLTFVKVQNFDKGVLTKTQNFDKGVFIKTQNQV